MKNVADNLWRTICFRVQVKYKSSIALGAFIILIID